MLCYLATVEMLIPTEAQAITKNLSGMYVDSALAGSKRTQGTFWIIHNVYIDWSFSLGRDKSGSVHSED